MSAETFQPFNMGIGYVLWKLSMSPMVAGSVAAQNRMGTGFVARLAASVTEVVTA